MKEKDKLEQESLDTTTQEVSEDQLIDEIVKLTSEIYDLDYAK
jgi:hypothetical protein